MRIWTRLLGAVGILAIAIGGFLLFRTAIEAALSLLPDQEAKPVAVPDEVLLEARPSAERSLIEKITTKRVRPTQSAVSVGRPDTARIRDFCAAAAAADTAVQTSAMGEGDSSTSDTTGHIPVGKPALLPPFAGRVRRGRLELHATLSSGRLWAAVYPITSRAEWVSSGDSAIVTTPRQLLGLLELDPGVFAEAEYSPVTQRLSGRAGVALGAPDRQLRAGVRAETNERPDVFVGVQVQR